MKKLFLILVLILSLAAVSTAQTATREYTLKPGWNAIYLDIQPENNRWSDLFTDVSADSVWFWNPGDFPVEFIQDPETLVPNQEGWLAYLPNEPTMLTSLYTAIGGHAYLIKSTASEDQIWNISGKPILPKINWKADSYNLVGFHVDSDLAVAPFFQTFFETSEAHQTLDIYHLRDNQTWTQVDDPSTTKMVAGEAVWVFCPKDSDFAGPLNVSLEQGSSMEFGTQLQEQLLILNHSVGGLAYIQAESTSLDLEYWDVSTATPGWNSLGSQSLAVNIDEPNSQIRMSVNRTALSMGTETGTIVNILDDNGMKIQVPVSAKRSDYSGLWVGSVRLNKVSEPNEDNTPKSTPAEFQFRLILHVDSNGTVSLVKEVTQMWDTIKKEYILVVTPSLLSNPDYTGTALRDGTLMGRRISSVVFGFDGAVPMTGAFGPGYTVTRSLSIGHNDPTNPFKHVFHPDHNNQNDNYDPYDPNDPVKEAFDITRIVKLVFQTTDPEFPSGAVTGWGDTVFAGTYEESLSGLHKDQIKIEGTFRLHKVSSINEVKL